MQKMLLNNSDQSLRLISMNKYHELRGQRVDRRCVRLREDWNKNVLTLCWEKWKKEGKKKKIKQEDVNVHAVLYWLLNVKWNKNQKQKMASTSALTHTCAPAHTHTHTHVCSERASCWSSSSAGGRGSGPRWADSGHNPGFVCQQQINQTWVSSSNTSYAPDITHTVSVMHLISLHFIHLGVGAGRRQNIYPSIWAKVQ